MGFIQAVSLSQKVGGTVSYYARKIAADPDYYPMAMWGIGPPGSKKPKTKTTTRRGFFSSSIASRTGAPGAGAVTNKKVLLGE